MLRRAFKYDAPFFNVGTSQDLRILDKINLVPAADTLLAQ